MWNLSVLLSRECHAIFVPSGDQFGLPSSSGRKVRRRTSELSTFATQTSALPALSRPLVKRRLLPSGDHAGPESKSSLGTKRFTLRPSASAMRIWFLPLALLVQATFSPSGDHAGRLSLPDRMARARAC